MVSVILPVYNGEKFVGDAIQSIQHQNFGNWELIILDDGSTDSSLHICQQYAASDQRIRVFSNQKNMGLAKTMNRLVALSIGKYIAVQEQDDISKPEKLMCEVELLESHPEVGLVSGVAEWIDDEGKVFYQFPGILKRGRQYPQDKERMVEYLYINHSKIVNAACMFRREITRQILGPFDQDARMAIDWQFFLHVAHHHLICGLPTVLVTMRRGANHQSLTRSRQLQFNEARRCIKLVYGFYRDKSDSPINYWLYRKSMATQMVLEGRCHGASIKGGLRLLEAIIYDPFNKSAWRSIFDMGLRAARKAKTSLSLNRTHLLR